MVLVRLPACHVGGRAENMYLVVLNMHWLTFWRGKTTHDIGRLQVLLLALVVGRERGGGWAGEGMASSSVGLWELHFYGQCFVIWLEIGGNGRYWQASKGDTYVGMGGGRRWGLAWKWGRCTPHAAVNFKSGTAMDHLRWKVSQNMINIPP